VRYNLDVGSSAPLAVKLVGFSFLTFNGFSRHCLGNMSQNVSAIWLTFESVLELYRLGEVALTA
jgi:hypothetical protein